MRGFSSVNAEAPEIVENYERAIGDTVRAYGVHSTTHLRFSEPIDETTLPQSVVASQEVSASVFVVNVTADSTNFGARHPAKLTFQRQATRYWPSNCITATPALGVALSWGETYAVVVTDELRTDDGTPFAASDDLRAVLDGEQGGDAGKDIEAIR